MSVMAPELVPAGSNKRKRNDLKYAHRQSRVKLASTPVNSSTSEPPISDKSAFIATSAASQTTDPSDLIIEESDPSSSELSESSEEPSSESSSEEEESDDSDSELEDTDEDAVVNLRANRGNKPNMSLKREGLGPDLRPWLKDFLPQLKAANEELEQQRKAGTLKENELEAETDDEAEYIEMDLGLGVLEQQGPDAHDESSTSGSECGEEGHAKEKDILGKLMGKQDTQDSVGIQLVQEAQGG